MTETWRGHFPIINLVLQALLKKRAAAGATGLSRAEGVLLTACQFWAAVGTHELAAYLAAEPMATLILAYEAFSEIGAVRVASALRMAVGERPDLKSSSGVEQQAVALAARLLDTEDAVDHLIAQFASEHLHDESAVEDF
jgi:hypothetical protein